MGVISRNGVLYADYRDANGHRVKKSFDIPDTKANRAKAEKVLYPQLMEEVRAGKFRQPSKVPTVEQMAKKSFDLRRKDRSFYTHKDYVGAYERYIRPMFGNRKLDMIKPSEIKLFQNYLHDQGLSGARIAKIRVLLNNIFVDAMMDELINRNPLAVVKTIPRSRDAKEKKPFSLEEIKTLLEHADGYLRNFIAVGFYTGMRSGEILGLMWSDIDMDNMMIQIKRGITKGLITATKTSRSQRQVEILEPLLHFLEDQHGITGDSNGYVFMTREGEHYKDVKHIRASAWKNLLKKANVPYRPIYNLRHTFASVMISKGEDMLWVSRMLGHKNLNITLEHYAKYVPTKTKIKRASFLDGW